MSSKKTKKSTKIITYDPNLKLSRFKKFQIRFNNKLERIKINLKINKNWIFYKDMISDIFIYSLLGVGIIYGIFFNRSLLPMGISLGAGLWLYINRIHEKLKEILGSIKLVNTVRYGK